MSPQRLPHWTRHFLALIWETAFTTTRYAMPNVSSTTKWFSSVSLWKKSSFQGCNSASVLTRTKRVSAQSSYAITLAPMASAVQLSLASSYSLAYVGTKKETGTFVKLPFISLGLGEESRLYFKPSNLFPRFSQVSLIPFMDTILASNPHAQVKGLPLH